MKKIISIFCVTFLCFGVFISGASNTKIKIEKTFSERFIISDSIIEEKNDFIYISINETESYLYMPGKPQLPQISMVLTFPLGTKISEISIKLQIESYRLNKFIVPCQQLMIISDSIENNENDIILNKTIYNSNSLYPKKMYDIQKGGGILDNEHVLFVNIKLYPQYDPMNNIIYVPKIVDINISYIPPEELLFTHNQYDMVIIAPDEFSNFIEPLIDHKNAFGVRTFLKTTNEIYTEFPGRDESEKIKYFIKNAVENYGIEYTFLIGDINIIPMRKSVLEYLNISIMPLTDLYYADIYDYNGDFCSWDSNYNNLFGEFSWTETYIAEYIDDVDLYPDIGIGRLPCSNIRELNNYIKKIITYETQAYGSNWFKKIVLIGGDTDPSIGTNEGEIITEIVGKVMNNNGFTPIKLYTSLNTFNRKSINNQITSGVGFVSIETHGEPIFIATFPPSGDKPIFYFTPYIIGMRNKDKLPIFFIDACLTGKLDFNIFGIDFPCFAWALLKKPFGGGIAAVASTYLTLIVMEEGEFIQGPTFLHLYFYESYKEGIILSQMLNYAKTNYINNIWKECLTLQEFNLIGDPSLKIGGYP